MQQPLSIKYIIEWRLTQADMSNTLMTNWWQT